MVAPESSFEYRPEQRVTYDMLRLTSHRSYDRRDLIDVNKTRGIQSPSEE